jgi:histidinol-phosphate aminotransferase
MDSSSNGGKQITYQNMAPTRQGIGQEGGFRPTHGGVKPAELRALGLSPDEVLDFSASISPLGPPEGVREALSRVDLTAYPDPQCLELREALSNQLNVGIERILVGNGSTELIHLIARAYLAPPRPGTTNTAFLLTPTYGEYTGACRLAGANIYRLAAYYSAGFRWDFAEAQWRIALERPGLVFVCNPNNPTGAYLQRPEVECLAEATADAGGLLVIDEAYISFVDHPWDSLALLKWDSVVLLRSMTKDYALTSLRLGYALSSPEVISRLASFQPDWSVNGLAQAAGLAALADAQYITRVRAAVNQSKEFLTQRLTALGFIVLPSTANFLLVQVGNGAIMREKLMRRGLFVRDCASFGLPDSIRIGIRPLPDCQRLAQAMKEVA